MGATIALQSAVVEHLNSSATLAGVYHDAPVRAPFPYAVLNCSDEKDWSCKGREGREIALQLAIWDEQPSRLLRLEDEIERILRTLAVSEGWQLSTLVLMGKQRLRTPGSPWSCTLELRARLFGKAPGAMA